MADTQVVKMRVERLPEGNYAFNEDPPRPGVVRWRVDNGQGGCWLVWAEPDWDGNRETLKEKDNE